MGMLYFNSFALLLILYLSWFREISSENIKTQTKLALAKQSISDAEASLFEAFFLISDAEINCRECPENKILYKPIDCLDVKNMGYTKSGLYQIWPRGLNVYLKDSINVYCDMETDGGGWTVIQRRGNFSKLENFFVDWEKYKTGFGDLTMEFWIGNENIYDLTHQGLYQARFDLKDVKGDKRFALYDTFYIEDEKANYKLHIGQYSGSAGDAMAQSNLAMFSTKDKLNDRSGTNCPVAREGGFWYYNCCKTNPNGLYQPGKSDAKSIYWYYWKGWDCLADIEIKIRRY